MVDNGAALRVSMHYTAAVASVAPERGDTWLMAYSARAVIVKLGLMPGLAGTTDASTTYRPG